MKQKIWIQRELKPAPATAAERQAKRKAKLLSDSQDKTEILKRLEIAYQFYYSDKGKIGDFVDKISEILTAYLPIKN